MTDLTNAPLIPTLDLAQIAEFIEGLSWEDHFLAAPEYLLWDQDLIIDHLNTALFFCHRSSYDLFYNRLIGLGLYETVSESMLDDLLSIIYSLGLPLFSVYVCPFTQPPEIHDWLNWRGFSIQDRHAKLVRGNHPIHQPPTDLRIELTGEDYADAFAYVAVESFGLPEVMYDWLKGEVGRPGWQHYVAWDGDQPVASGAMFIRDQVAWLGHGGTLPQARRRGAQLALLARRIHDGLQLGCRWFVTETDQDLPWRPNSSYRNILRSGFQLAYLRDNYVFCAEP